MMFEVVANLPSLQDLIFSQDTNGILGRARAFDRFGMVLGSGDFNGDGRSDLTIANPYESVFFNGETAVQAGTAHVLYGSLTGPSVINDDYWHQGVAGVIGTPQGTATSEFTFADHFGHSVAAGDFDGDGYDDVSFGVPGESNSEGGFNVLYGSNSGLTAAGDQFWRQDSPGVIGLGESFDRLGASLASGDFDGDGYDDLAAGAPSEGVLRNGQNHIHAGAVNVLYGSSSGLTAAGNQIWHQGREHNGTTVQGVAEIFDSFGETLAAGDFDGDGYDDLVAGVPGEGVSFNGSNAEGAGAVNVLYGSSNGLTAVGNQIWSQNTFQSGVHVEGGSERDDAFGSSLGVGDFNGDGRDDLAIGVRNEALGFQNGSGAVNVLYGSNSGLTAVGNQIWHQNSPGIQGVANSSEHFGTSLAAGDFNNDGYEDLAIGTSQDDVNGVLQAGSVSILYGSAMGLTAIGNQLLYQDAPGVQGVGEAYDYFGASLGSGDYNGDGYADLAVGVTGEDVGNISNAGAVNIFFGSASGLVT